jgi:outer membrane protein insertion porin family
MKSLRSIFPLALALLLLALPGQSSAQEKSKEIIREIEFEGIKRIAKGELINRIVSRVGDNFDPEKLIQDIERLYRLGQFDSPDKSQTPIKVQSYKLPGGGIKIVFKVSERPVIVRLKVAGAKAFKSSEIAEAIRSEVGRVFDSYLIDRDVQRLKDILLEKGYLFAKVSYKTETTDNGNIRLLFETSAGPQVTIDELQFIGVEFFEDTDIFTEIQSFKSKPRTFFGLGEEGYFSRKNLNADLEIIARFYRSRGFLDAQVSLEKLRFSTDRKELVIVIRVREGQRYTVRKVDILGNLIYSRKIIRSQLALHPGSPFLGNELLKDVQAIQKLYAKKAYIHAKARFDVVYDQQRKLLDVVYSISEGPQVKVERILIEGNEKTKDKVIRRNLSIFPGQQFDGAKLEASLGRLGRLRYFDDLDIDFREGSKEGSEDLVIKVKEARTGSFVIGGGVSTNAGFFGNIVLNQRNFDITDVPTSLSDITSGRLFTGAGQSFTVSAQPGRERSQYRISFNDPFFLDTAVLFGIDAFIFDRVRPQYREGRLGLLPSFGVRMTQDITARLRYRIEQVRVFDIDFDAIPDPLQVAGNNLVSGAELALVINKNFIDTQFVRYAGWGATASYEVLGGPFGGDVELSRARFKGNWQTTLLEFPNNYKWVFGLRGQASWQQAFGSDKKTPIFERFFAGGVRSFRGFEFRSISPRDPTQTDEPRGGDFLVLGTADFSFPIFKGFLRGVLFIDGGTVENDIQSFRSNRVRFAAGIGTRINIAIFPAPVALDFAFPLRSRRIDDEQIFSFSVGVGF